MNSWHVFAWIYTSFDVPFLAAVNQASGNLARALILPATVGATIYIGFMAFQDIYNGLSGNPLTDLIRRVIRIGLILACIGGATYTGEISILILTTIPGELSAAIAGNGAVSGADAFDKVLGSSWAASSQVLDNLSAWAIGKTIVLGLFVLVYQIVSAIGVGIAFTLWLLSHVGLGLVVAVGPLAIACLLMPQTGRFFNGWLATAATFIVCQLLTVVTITVLIATIQITLGQILGVNGATGANANDVGGQIHQLVNAAVMFVIAGFVSLSIVPMARAIGGGAAAELSGVSRWAHGAMATGAKAAGGGVVSGARAAGSGLGRAGAAGMRSLTPAGKGS